MIFRGDVNTRLVMDFGVRNEFFSVKFGEVDETWRSLLGSVVPDELH